MSNNCVNDLVCERQQVKVFLSSYIEFPKINIDFQLPIFLVATIIEDNHVASSNGLRKPVVSNLSISCLTIAA